MRRLLTAFVAAVAAAPSLAAMRHPDASPLATLERLAGRPMH